MTVTVDEGPDENSRYEKTVNCLIKHFVENDLDAFFLATNAPDSSAFNPVERRMVKLNKELSGGILKHDKFGSDLDTKDVTVDKDLELKNFEYDRRTLIEIWSGLVIDENSVVAEFIKDDAPVIMGNEFRRLESVSRSAIAVFHTIVKCKDQKCCSSFQSTYLKVATQRSLPPPLPVVYTRNGIEWAKDDKRCHLLIPVSEYFLAKCLDACSRYKEISQGNNIRLFLSICGSRYDHTTNVLSLWSILFAP